MYKFTVWNLVVALASANLLATYVDGQPAQAEEPQARREPRRQRDGRPLFEQMLRWHDSDDDGKIDKKEFPGPEQFFRRLDADKNGTVDKQEFESGRNRRRRKPENRKVRDEGKGSTASPRMKRFEVFPTQKPAPGDKAPEIELRDLQGNLVSLSDLLKTKPVILETGSYTCPVFRGRHASIEKLHEEFGDQVHLVVLYGKEAHPGSARFQEVKQPKEISERIKLARAAVKELSIGVPVLADDVNNLITAAYGGLPNSGYLIGQDGRVFHKLSWIHPALLREPLEALLKSDGRGGLNPPSFQDGSIRPYDSGKPQTDKKQTRKKQPNKPQTRKKPKAARNLRIPDGVTLHADIEYAKVDGHSLQLDLYLPDDSPKKTQQTTQQKTPPLLVWIHGGGWKNGDKQRINPMFIRLAGEGFATASINYRLNGLMDHPNHIHDCKGAVRWLRANAERYGYDTTRIGVGGGSAGGHLALMLGMTAEEKSLEGDIGGNLDQSSRVQAVLDLFGPSEFLSFSKGNSRFRFRHQVSEDRLRSASPLHYLTNDDAPVLIFHGEKDPVVPASQSKLLHDRYQKLGLESSLHLLADTVHGGPRFSDATRYALTKAFFERHLAQ